MAEERWSNKKCFSVTYQVTKTEIVEAATEQSARDAILNNSEHSNVSILASCQLGPGPWLLGSSD